MSLSCQPRLQGQVINITKPKCQQNKVANEAEKNEGSKSFGPSFSSRPLAQTIQSSRHLTYPKFLWAQTKASDITLMQFHTLLRCEASLYPTLLPVFFVFFVFLFSISQPISFQFHSMLSLPNVFKEAHKSHHQTKRSSQGRQPLNSRLKAVLEGLARVDSIHCTCFSQP